jgi:hypothetical protein
MPFQMAACVVTGQKEKETIDLKFKCRCLPKKATNQVK